MSPPCLNSGAECVADGRSRGSRKVRGVHPGDRPQVPRDADARHPAAGRRGTPALHLPRRLRGPHPRPVASTITALQSSAGADTLQYNLQYNVVLGLRALHPLGRAYASAALKGKFIALGHFSSRLASALQRMALFSPLACGRLTSIMFPHRTAHVTLGGFSYCFFW